MKARLFLAALALFLVSGSLCAKTDDNAFCESYVQYAPGLMDLSLPLFGVSSNCDFTDRLIKLCTAYAFEVTLVKSLKFLVDEQRPDGSAHNSFPSGHTATAFVGAELLRQDYGWGWGAAGYAAGAYVATMRVVHQRHWWWDTVAGAAAGIGCSLAAKALCPLIREHIVDPLADAAGIRLKSDSNISLCPAVDPLSGATLAQVSFRF